MPVKKPTKARTAKELARQLQMTKQHRSPIDRTSRYHAELCDLAREHGLEPADVADEWAERAMAREYVGAERDEAEAAAFADVQERLA